jgi:hypothetical protein
MASLVHAILGIRAPAKGAGRGGRAVVGWAGGAMGRWINQAGEG